MLEDKNVFASLMERVGQKGSYQNMVVLISCLLTYISGGLMLMPSFLFFQDSYTCKDQLTAKACLDFVCSLDPPQRAEYLPQPPSILSVVNKFRDYHCEPEKAEVTAVQTVAYGGAILCVIFLTAMGDRIGRKYLTFINLIVLIVGVVLIILCQDMWMAGAGLFLGIFGAKNKCYLTLMFTVEIVHEGQRAFLMIVVSVFFSISGLTNVLCFFLLESFEDVLIFIYLIPSLVLAAALAIFVQDTPVSLINLYSAKEAHKSFSYMAEMNKKADFDLTLNEL